MHDKERRRLMILGGGGAQLLPLIQASKNEGYFTILVGNISGSPGAALCDRYYNADCTDEEQIIRIARQENIDGVIGNAEYAMHYVSVVAEALGLRANPVSAVDLLNSKYDFRELTRRLGLYAPKAVRAEELSEACVAVTETNLEFPVVVKPEKCSASRGTAVVKSLPELRAARGIWDACRDYSSTKKVVVEEYAVMADPANVIDGDIFVHNGNILWNGLFSGGRSKNDVLFPMSQSYPPFLTDAQMAQVREGLERIVRSCGITFGALNVEAFFTDKDRLFFIEINARQGGNGIPYMIRKHCGIDMSRLLVTTAAGDDAYFNEVAGAAHCCRLVSRQQCFWHAKAGLTGTKNSGGGYKCIVISPEIRRFVTDIQELVPKGSFIYPAQKGTDVLAFVDLEFPDRQTQEKYMRNIEDYIYPEVEQE